MLKDIYLRSVSIMGEAVPAAATAGAPQVEIVVFKEAVSISHARGTIRSTVGGQTLSYGKSSIT